MSFKIDFDKIDYDSFIDNFNILQKNLGLTNIKISKVVGYDTSFISRMKIKERKPSNLENFLLKLNNYLIEVCKDKQKLNIMSKLLNCKIEDLEDPKKFNQIFTKWICAKHIEKNPNNISNFLNKLDNFNLNDYINTDFSKFKIPTSPIILKNSKIFFGTEGRKKAESQFLITTLISKSTEPIFFYSDLPILEASNDTDFKNKWVFTMAQLLKKGLHLNIVHNINRPIDELLLGLESWLPIYMTGSISSYYFKTPPSNFFYSSLCTSRLSFSFF